MWPRRRPLIQLLIVTTVVHAGVLIVAHVRTGSIDTYAFQSLDCPEYYRIAQNLARHGSFSDDESPPLTPDTWRTPGYPLVLAVLMIVLGDSPVALILVQQLLSILNVFLVFWIVERWMDPRRALLVAALFLIEPYHLFYSLWLMSTTLFVTVLLATWLVWLRAIQTGRLAWFALLGALSGYLVLIRPIGGLVPIVLLAGLVIAAAPFRRKRASQQHVRLAWPAIPTFAVACVVVAGSWMLRNHVVAGHFALSDQGGVVLAYFKATEVELWRQGRAVDRYVETSLDSRKLASPHTVWDEIDLRLKSRLAHLPEDQRAALRWQNLAQGNRTETDSFEVSKALSEIGRRYLAASPVTTAACYLARCGSILTFPLNLALKPPKGVEGSRWGWALTGSVYLLLCLWVLVRLCRGGLTLDQIYFPLSCTIALLLATTPQIDPRFHVPMIPLLVVVALLPKPGKTSQTDGT